MEKLHQKKSYKTYDYSCTKFKKHVKSKRKKKKPQQQQQQRPPQQQQQQQQTESNKGKTKDDKNDLEVISEFSDRLDCLLNAFGEIVKYRFLEV